MRRAGTAITWQIWRRNLPGLVVVLSTFIIVWAGEHGLAVCLGAPLGSLLQHPAVAACRNLAGWLLLIAFLLMGVSILAVLVMGSFTEPDSRGVEGFPVRMFPLPVSTLTLARWPLGMAVALVVCLYGAWAFLVFRPLGIELPVGLPMVSAAAGMAGVQAVVWRFPAARAVKLLVLAAVAVELAALNVWAFSAVRVREIVLPGLQNIMPDWPAATVELYNRLALACAVGQVLAAVYMAVGAVRCQRHGRMYLRRKRAEPSSTRDGAASLAGRAFRSLVHAQLWFEWRRNARVLPACIALALALLFGPVPWLTGVEPDSTLNYLVILSLLPIGLALILGKGFSKLDFWARDFDMAPFLAVRPLSSETLTFVKMGAAALSVAAAWGLMLLLVPLWLAIWVDGDALAQMSERLLAGHSGFQVVLILIHAVLSGMVITWGFMVNYLYLGLWGRSGPFFAGIALSLASTASVVYFTCWVLEPSLAAYRILISLPWILAVLGVAFIVKMAVAVVAFHKAHSQGLFSTRAFRIYLGIWVAALGPLVLFPFLVFPHSAWVPQLFGLGAFLLVPLGRIALAPMALNGNRRRGLKVTL